MSFAKTLGLFSVVAISVVALVTGCAGPYPKGASPKDSEAHDEMKSQLARSRDYLPKLIYNRDPRTDVCFASNDLGSDDSVFTQVPCSVEVLNEIVKENS
jgi:hypothetical protein